MLRFVLIIIATAVVLPSCMPGIGHLRDKDLSANEFHIQLAREYLEFAESEADQYDWVSSAYFARKGIASFEGKEMPPEDPRKWSVPSDILPAMLQAREYLILALTPKATASFPHEAARAQFLFDCWVEQQEEAWQHEDIEYCRENFYNTLDRLFMLTLPDFEIPHIQRQVEAYEKAPEKKPKPAPVSTAPHNKTYVVYFAFDGYKTDQKTDRILSNIVALLKDTTSYDITLNGYSDTVGGKEYNHELSNKRARAIKEKLVDLGLDKNSITIFAFGKTENRVTTADNMREQENRAVEIVINYRY